MSSNFQLTPVAYQKALDVLGADGKLTLRILRTRENEVEVKLDFEDVTMFTMDPFTIHVGDEIQLGGLKIGMDIGQPDA